MAIKIENINPVRSSYDGENLAGNGIRFTFRSREYIYQWFDLGYALRVKHEGKIVSPALLRRLGEHWKPVIAADPVGNLGIQYHDGEGYHIEPVDADFANDMAAIYAAEDEIKALVVAAKSDQIIDRTPWQKGDDQDDEMPVGSYIV